MSNSEIIKAPFVAMSDIRREIKTVDPRDPKIISSLPGEEEEAKEQPINEETQEEEAIDDDVIDGSVSMLLDEAREEAERILREAREVSEQILEEARQEGFDMGYQEGVAKGEEDMSLKEQALEEKALRLDELFERSLQEIEPQVALIIKDLVEGMVGHYADDEGVILFLVKLALSEIKTYGSFIIKVAPEDFEAVTAHQSELMAGLSDKISLEILKDSALEPKACIIETEAGTVDASLNTRLESLGRELRLISDSLKHGQKE